MMLKTITYASVIAIFAASPAFSSPKGLKAACQDMQASTDLFVGAEAVTNQLCEGDLIKSDRCGVALKATDFAKKAAAIESMKCDKALTRAKNEERKMAPLLYGGAGYPTTFNTPSQPRSPARAK